MVYNLYLSTCAHNEAYIAIFSRDRLQTTINVMGDTFAAAVVAKYSQDDFVEEKPHSADSVELFENLAKDVLPDSEETNL